MGGARRLKVGDDEQGEQVESATTDNSLFTVIVTVIESGLVDNQTVTVTLITALSFVIAARHGRDQRDPHSSYRQRSSGQS